MCFTEREENIMCQVFAGQDPARYASRTRRLRLNGQSTSIRLENAFWDILDQIAEADNVSTPAFISKLHSEVLETRGEPVNFTSLLRTACLIFVAQSEGADHRDQSVGLAAE
jgi:predicted DNA-binding ribbon-helix-helix protein